MAKVNYADIVIPSNPKDRVIIANALSQIVDSKLIEKSAKELQADIKKEMKKEYNLPTDIINAWVADLQDPEKRRLSEEKYELLETGRILLIDNALDNRKAAASVEAKNLDFSDHTVSASDTIEEIFHTKQETTPKRNTESLLDDIMGAEEPVVELVEEPVVEDDEEPVTELVEEPVTELVEEPVVELVEEPVVEDDGFDIDSMFEEPADEVVEEPVVEDDGFDIDSMFEEPVVEVVETESTMFTDEELLEEHNITGADTGVTDDFDIDAEFDFDADLSTPTPSDTAEIDDEFAGLLDELDEPEVTTKAEPEDDFDIDAMFDEI